MAKCRRPHLRVSGVGPHHSPSRFQWKFLINPAKRKGSEVTVMLIRRLGALSRAAETRPLSDNPMRLHTFTEPALSFDCIISSAHKSLKGGHCQFLSEVKVDVALVPKKRHRMQDAVGAAHAHMTREAN